MFSVAPSPNQAGIAQQSQMMAYRRLALIELLEAEHPGTDTHVLQAWYFIAIAYVIEGEFGPGFNAALQRLLPLLDAENRADFESDLADYVGAERAHLLLEQSQSL